MCDCDLRNTLRRNRRITQRKLQIELPFPAIEVAPEPHYRASVNLLLQQPSKFPPGSYRRHLDDPNSQARYEQNWILVRKDAGLPCVVLYPWPMKRPAGKTCATEHDIDISAYRVENSVSNAVSGQFCDSRRMTA